MKHCRLNVRKAIITTVVNDVIAGRKSYKIVPGTFNKVQIISKHKDFRHWNIERRIAENKINQINKLYKGHIKAILTTYTPNQPVEFEIIASKSYIEHEFNKLKPSEQDNTPADFSRDMVYFNYDAALLEQENREIEQDRIIEDEQLEDKQVEDEVETEDLFLMADISNLDMSPRLIDYLYENSSKKLHREEFEVEAKKYVNRSRDIDYNEVIEQLKCL